MRDLSGTNLEAAQKAMGDALCKIVLTSGANTYTYGLDTTDRILHITHPEQEWSQTAEVLINDTDGTVAALDLWGYKGVISNGYHTTSDEYSACAPLWVVGQKTDSFGGGLVTRFSLAGTFNLMNEDKASSAYTPDTGDTSTVKDLLTEVITLAGTGSDAQETQEASDSNISLYGALRELAGQRMWIRERKVTKISFKLSKSGSPSGSIYFVIQSTYDDSILARKEWGNATTLTTTPTWCQATLTTAVDVTDEVRLYCEFTDGDSNNYVQVRYKNGAVKTNEFLVEYDGSSWTQQKLQDLAYRYTYKARPIAVFDHCTAYTVVYDPYGTHTGGTHATIMTDSAATFKTDVLIGQVIYNTTDDSSGTITDNDATTVTVSALSGGSDNQWEVDDAYTIEDSLLDSYQPKDAFTIAFNESRLSVIKKLIKYTKCKARVEDDEKIHISAPTISGSTYDYEYDDTYGDYHNFFSKSSRKRLVIPNYIVVSSHPAQGDDYTGYAEDTASSDLIEIRDHKYVRATGNAQCTAIATALLQHRQLAAERGSGFAPMNVGQEVLDYVKITDSRANDTRIGNIGYLNRTYTFYPNRPSRFLFEFRFGVLALEGLAGTMPTKIVGGEGVRGGQVSLTALWDAYNSLWGYLDELQGNIKLLLSYILEQRESTEFAKLSVTEELEIPQGANKYAGGN